MSEANPAGTSALSDPLIGAMVNKLPMPGSPYPLAQRINWLKMFVMALNEAYGVEDPITVSTTGEMRPPAPSRGFAFVESASGDPPVLEEMSRTGQPRYRVDAQGFALFGETPIDPQDVPAGAVIYDERGKLEQLDLSTILWKTSGAIAAEKLPHLQLRAA